MEHLATRFQSFREFYPFYLGEHLNPVCRVLHFAGSTVVLLLIVAALMTGQWILLAAVPFAGYGFAWIGHFVFEKNRPATFKYPAWSFMGDWVMYWQLLTRQIHFDGRADRQATAQ
jgi:hypothetical protein